MTAHVPRIPFSLHALVAEARRRARRRRVMLAVAVAAIALGGGGGAVYVTHPFGWLRSSAAGGYQQGIVFFGHGGAYINTSAVLTGVSAASDDAAWIVGDSSTGFGPLAWRWDGGAWRSVPLPGGQTAELSSVVTVSPNDAWAVGRVGSRVHALIEHWDGVRWTVARSPRLPGSTALQAVSASGARSVWAIGATSPTKDVLSPKARPLLLHWDGTSWRPQALPWARPGMEVEKVVATGSSSVWVLASVGYQSSVVEYWDGARWRSVPAPFGPNDPIAGFTATAWNDAWAVGSWGVGIGVGNYSHPLAAHWNGSSWTFTRVPSLPGSNSAALESVVAVRPDDVWATGPSEHFVLGKDEVGEQRLQELFLHWDGRSWRIVPRTGRASQALPEGRGSLPGRAPSLAAAPDGAVWAIGNCNAANLVTWWNGSTWVTARHPRGQHWPPGASSLRGSPFPSCPSGPLG